MDLSGLPETAVDSEEDDDEEDIERASDPLMSRDIVRDCLEKDPMDRTDDDIGETRRHVGDEPRVRRRVCSLRKCLQSKSSAPGRAGTPCPTKKKNSLLSPSSRSQWIHILTSDASECKLSSPPHAGDPSLCRQAFLGHSGTSSRLTSPKHIKLSELPQLHTRRCCCAKHRSARTAD